MPVMQYAAGVFLLQVTLCIALAGSLPAKHVVYQKPAAHVWLAVCLRGWHCVYKRLQGGGLVKIIRNDLRKISGALVWYTGGGMVHISC